MDLSACEEDGDGVGPGDAGGAADGLLEGVVLEPGLVQLDPLDLLEGELGVREPPDLVLVVWNSILSWPNLSGGKAVSLRS